MLGLVLLVVCTSGVPLLWHEEGEKVTWGGLLRGVMGLLLFLAVSGVWLWWPGFRHWVRGARVRLRKGRYAATTTCTRWPG